MPFSILVVCVGNVCRSPLAERLLRLRLDELLTERGSKVTVESAGLMALAGNAMDPASAAELVRLGGEPDGFFSRQLLEAQLKDADLILTATKELRSRLLEDVPSALRGTFTLTEFAALVEGGPAASPQQLLADAAVRRPSAEPATYDLDDPIGASPEVHRDVSDVIDRCTRIIATAIAESLSGTAKSRSLG